MAGKPKAAIPYFVAIVHLQPEWSQYHIEAFHMCKQHEVVDALREAFRRLQKDGTDAFALWYSLGLAAHSMDDLDEAVPAYVNGVACNPGYAPLHYNLGLAEFALGQLDKSIERQREALRLSPDFAEAHYALGMSLLRCHERSEGIQHLETYVRLNRPHLARYVANCSNFLKTLTGRITPGAVLSDAAEYRRLKNNHREQ